MKNGCKIWLYILMIGGLISFVAGFLTLPYSITAGVWTVILAGVQMIGVAVLLFKQRKEGFYILCVMRIADLIYNIIVVQQVNVIFTLIPAIAMLAITYLFINKGMEQGETNENSVVMSNGNMESTNEATVLASTNTENAAYSNFTANDTDYKSGEQSNTARTYENRNASRSAKNNRTEEQKTPVFGSGKNMEIETDLYKELEIDRAWDEKMIRDHLKKLLKIWTQRQGATNDEQQLLEISNVLDLIESGFRFLTKATKRKQYDASLEAAYKNGKLTDEAEEKLYTILDQAREYYRKGNIKLATKFAEEVVAEKVNDVSAYEFLARCYMDVSAYNKALNTIDQGLAIFNDNLKLHWLGARIETVGTKNFDNAQKRVNKLIEIAPNESIGYSEQINLHLQQGDENLAFSEIDAYIAEHPDDNNFRQGVAYELDAYSKNCYYYDASQNVSFIADKQSYNKCLNLCEKAVEVYADEYTQKQLKRAQSYGKKEWNDWNLPSIKSLAIYGSLFVVMGFASEAFLMLGAIFYTVMGILIYFSFRPYWQIYKTYVTGKMGSTEQIISIMGEQTAKTAELIFNTLMKVIGLIFKVVLGLASGRWF